MAPSASLRKALAELAEDLPPGTTLDQAETELEAAYEAAATQWPRISVPPAAFVAFVAQRLPAESWSERLSSLHLEDLFLACGCVRAGDEAAATFLDEFTPKIDGIFRDAPVAGVSTDDFRHRVVAHILVGEDGGQPRLAQYGGKGELRYWVGVVAGRLLADLARARSVESPTAPEQLAVLPSPDDSPEAVYLRHYYRAQFEAALQQAFAELDPRDRDLLRFHVVDQMPTSTIAAVFDIHRGTAARWLKEARQKLLWATRDQLVDHFEVPRGELESILRMVQSQLELSVRRLLQP